MKELPKKYHDTASASQVQLSKLIFTHNWEDPSMLKSKFSGLKF